MKQKVQNSATLPRFLLACTLIALRAPVAHQPDPRNLTTFPPSPITNHASSVILDNNGLETDKTVASTDPIDEISVSCFDSDLLSMSKARVYADVNVLRPKEYWDYESLSVQWG